MHTEHQKSVGVTEQGYDLHEYVGIDPSSEMTACICYALELVGFRA